MFKEDDAYCALVAPEIRRMVSRAVITQLGKHDIGNDDNKR